MPSPQPSSQKPLASLTPFSLTPPIPTVMRARARRREQTYASVCGGASPKSAYYIPFREFNCSSKLPSSLPHTLEINKSKSSRSSSSADCAFDFCPARSSRTRLIEVGGKRRKRRGSWRSIAATCAPEVFNNVSRADCPRQIDSPGGASAKVSAARASES